MYNQKITIAHNSIFQIKLMTDNLSYSAGVLRRIYGFSLALLMFSLVGGAGLVCAESPASAVAELLDKIKQTQNDPSLSAEQNRANRKTSQVALGYLDIPRISQKALGKHWPTLDQNQQESFVRLLSELFIYVAFPNSASFFGELKINYGPGQLAESRATVPLQVHHQLEGNINLDFVLWQSQDRWRVIDVVLDGVSMANNLRSQFSKILKKNNYAELVRRLEKKLRKVKG